MYSDDEPIYEDVDDYREDDEDYIDADEVDEDDEDSPRERARRAGGSPFASRSSGSPFASRSSSSSSSSPFGSRSSGSSPFGARSSSSPSSRSSSGSSSSGGGVEALRNDPEVIDAVKSGGMAKAIGVIRKKDRTISMTDARDLVNSISDKEGGGSSSSSSGGGSSFGGGRSSSSSSSSPSSSSARSGGSPFGGGRSSSSSSSSSSPSSGSTRSGGSPFGGGRSSSSSSSSSSPSSGSTRSGGSPFGGGRSSSSSSSSSSPSSGSARSGGSPFGGGRSSSSSSGDSSSSGSARSGGSPFGGGRSSSSDSSSGRSGGGLPGRNRAASSGASKPVADKKDKDNDDKSGIRLSGLRDSFGSVSNLFGGGGGDKSGDSDSGGGLLGGITSRLSFGGGGDDADKKKPTASKASSTSSAKSSDESEGGGFLGGITSRLPFVGGGDDADEKKSAKSSSPKKSARASKKDADDSESSGLFGGRLGSIMPSFGGGGDADEKTPRSKTAKQRDKTPKVASGDGLTLDRKLDILGAGLLLGSIALMLSRLSPTQGIITEGINNLIGQLLGWGSLAVPLSMFGVGVWLIIRHFGDEPPTVDTERIIGLGITYVGLLVMFQFIQSMNYSAVTSFADLEIQTRLSWEVLNNGGGWVGGNAYLLLVRYLGEILAFAVNVFVLIVGIMFMLDVSLSEIAIVAIGLYRSFRSAQRRSAERKKVRRAERLSTRREQMESLVAPPPNIEVSAPRAEALSAGSSAGALPAPGSDRAINITMGGRTVQTSMSGEKIAVPVGANAGNASGGSSSGPLGGLLGALPFGGGSGGNDTQAAPPAENQQTKASSGGSSSGPLGGLLGALPFGGSSDNGENAAPKAALPANNAQAAPSQARPPQSTDAAPAPQAGQTAAPPQQQPLASTAPANPAQAAPSAATTPGSTSSPFSRPAPQTQSPPSIGSKRITGVMEAVNSDDEDDEDDEDVATQGTRNTMTREERLNAIRRGGASSVLNEMSKPEDATPDQPDTTQSPGSVTANTDAYGNAPTAARSVNPAERKPAPRTPPGAPSAPTKLPIQAREWNLPNIDELLNEGSEQDFDRQFLVEQARIIEDTLKSFGAPGRVVEINTGPVITQYGVEPDYLQSRSGKKSRVKVSAIAQLDRDLQLALGARSIRIEAPVPGKGYVGIEIPNAENALVSLKDVMQSEMFRKKRNKSPLSIALGQSVDGTPIAANLDSMPHMLIAGTTGSGKSVCINSIICSLLANNSPEELKFIMVDPKRVELTGYNGVPHLVAPVVVELERIVGVLKWVTREMDERYKRFSNAGARNIVDFNKHLVPGEERMPFIVVIIDELADLMMLAPEETERTITRIAALARATGIHLVIATQRPSVDVVTGLIKANFPARVAFAVAGSVDSRVILDQPGAERLLGRGDMLYLSGDSPAPMRLQGVFVSDEEIDNITRYWKTQAAGAAPAPTRKMAPLSLDPASAPRQMTPSGASGVAPSFPSSGGSGTQQAFWENGSANDNDDDDDDTFDESSDELYEDAVELVRRQNKASVSMLQRKLRIGYTRASRLIDLMERTGVVGPQESGSKPREVLME